MGQAQSFKKDKCASLLRQANGRMNIHRQKKLNGIQKLKDDICKHLSAQNEVNAKIWAETLINDENLVPCYDVASTMCDQVKGRLEYIQKFGAPPDMAQTFATLIHVAPKLGVEELMEVSKQLTAIMGKEFALQASEDKSIINPLVASNIDFVKPEDGHVVYRMRQLAKERNIQYEPSYEMKLALNSYLDRKGLADPLDDGGSAAMVAAAPVYQPQMDPGNQPGGGMPPQGPPGGGMGGPPGGGPGGNVMNPPQYAPVYNGDGSQMPPGGQQFMQQPHMQPQMQQPMMPPMQPPPMQQPMMPPMQPPMQPTQPPAYGLDPNATGSTAMPGMDNMAHGMPVQPGQQPIMPQIQQPPQQPQPPGGGIDDLEARLRALDGK